MHILYVDESGDPGEFIEGESLNSKHYILSALIISQEEWFNALDKLKKLRAVIKEKFNLSPRVEIHANELIRIDKIEQYRKIKKRDRLNILHLYTSQIPIIFDTAKVINICLDKTELKSKKDIQELAWSRLIQRYDTYLTKSVKDKGIIVSDTMNQESLIRNTIRRMRVYNPTPSHYGQPYDNPIKNIIEDPFNRESKHSYFIQTVDVIAQILYRKEYPKPSLKKYNVDKLFKLLEPILLSDASRNDEFGIVRK
jgi:hypothetical protein